jgi:hypothetical protein
VAQTPEGKVKAAVKAWLKARGIWYCMPMGTGFGNSGVPDFICCWNGRFLAIETKAPGKRSNTTVMQDNQIMGIHQANGMAIVVDSIEQLDQLEERLGREPL